jgi:hypothetical protein
MLGPTWGSITKASLEREVYRVSPQCGVLSYSGMCKAVRLLSCCSRSTETVQESRARGISAVESHYQALAEPETKKYKKLEQQLTSSQLCLLKYVKCTYLFMRLLAFSMVQMAMSTLLKPPGRLWLPINPSTRTPLLASRPCVKTSINEQLFVKDSPQNEIRNHYVKSSFIKIISPLFFYINYFVTLEMLNPLRVSTKTLWCVKIHGYSLMKL